MQQTGTTLQKTAYFLFGYALNRVCITSKSGRVDMSHNEGTSHKIAVGPGLGYTTKVNSLVQPRLNA